MMAYYSCIQNLNIHFRVASFQKEGDSKVEAIPYSQVILTDSDMEDMMEEAGVLAENVSLFYQKDTIPLAEIDLNKIRQGLTDTFVDFWKCYGDEWINHKAPLLISGNDEQNKGDLRGYLNVIDYGNYEIRTYLFFTPIEIAKEQVFPERPGGVINHFYQIGY